jgi:hypothetical protein
MENGMTKARNTKENIFLLSETEGEIPSGFWFIGSTLLLYQI